MSIATIPSDAISCLTAWVRDGYLNPQVDYFLCRPHHDGSSWYTSLRKAEGVAEADETAWLLGRVAHLRSVAAAIKPVGEAMLALADEVSTAYHFVHYVSTGSCLGYPSASKTGPEGRLLTIFNPEVPWCSRCRPLVHADLFGPEGTLGLKSVNLLVDGDNPTTTKLGLTLPLRGSTHPHAADGFCVAEFGLDGMVKATQFAPFVFPENFLSSVLGIGKLARALGHDVMSGRDSDEYLGAPGATDQLINMLPALATYLKEAARRFNPHHSHSD